jgi:hypothetical protein
MNDINAEEHYKDEHDGNESQNDDATHSASAFLHVYLSLVDVGLCHFDVPVCVADSVSYQV